MSKLCDEKTTLTADEYLEFCNIIILRHSEEPGHRDAVAEWDLQVNEGGFLLRLRASWLMEATPTRAGITSEVMSDFNLVLRVSIMEWHWVKWVNRNERFFFPNQGHLTFLYP